MAAAIKEGELRPDGSPTDPWRLCTVQQVEEVKCLLRAAPIWASGIVCFLAMAQQRTISVLRALKMGRHLGPHFQVPPGSLFVISMFVLSAFVPLDDRVLVPAAAGATGLEGGITLLQRMGARHGHLHTVHGGRRSGGEAEEGVGAAAPLARRGGAHEHQVAGAAAGVDGAGGGLQRHRADRVLLQGVPGAHEERGGVALLLQHGGGELRERRHRGVRPPPHPGGRRP